MKIIFTALFITAAILGCKPSQKEIAEARKKFVNDSIEDHFTKLENRLYCSPYIESSSLSDSANRFNHWALIAKWSNWKGKDSCCASDSALHSPAGQRWMSRMEDENNRRLKREAAAQAAKEKAAVESEARLKREVHDLWLEAEKRKIEKRISKQDSEQIQDKKDLQHIRGLKYQLIYRPCVLGGDLCISPSKLDTVYMKCKNGNQCEQVWPDTLPNLKGD